MNILLTHGYFLHEDPREQAIMRPYPPLGLLYISAWLEQNGFDNEVFDATFSSLAALQQRLLQSPPQLLGIYTNLMTKLNVLKLIRFVRSEPALQQTKIILGGPEVRNHKENFLAFGADVIVFGEGEDTMLELAKAYAASPDPDLTLIPGIAYKQQDAVMVNDDRLLIRDVNQLPFPNRKKIDLQKYFDAWKAKHGISMVNLNTMRGCPYSCRWCSRAVYGASYRRRSPSLVVDEIQWLQANYQFDMIWFVDDVFTINHKWLREFAQEMQSRGVQVPYEIITRSDRVTPEVLDLLKASGCARIWIGAESGSQKIIDAMDRRVKVEEVRAAIQAVKAKGMQAGTFIMLGYPGEEESDILETLQHLKESNPDWYTITIAYPIKGTPLYQEVQNDFTHQPAWSEGTDRDIDFKRRYRRRYYNKAIQWINNEMYYLQHRGQRGSMRARIQAIKARGLMWLYKYI